MVFHSALLRVLIGVAWSVVRPRYKESSTFETLRKNDQATQQHPNKHESMLTPKNCLSGITSNFYPQYIPVFMTTYKQEIKKQKNHKSLNTLSWN